MKKVLALFLGALVAAANAIPVRDSPLEFGEIVREDVFESFETSERVDVLIEMKEHLNVLQRVVMSGVTARADRAKFVFDSLRAFSQSNQASVNSLISTHYKEYKEVKSFWITNTMLIREATPALVSLLSHHPDVAEITTDFTMDLHEPVEKVENVEKSAGNEWGVNMIGAANVWAAGNRGEGIVVANVDTGVRWTHEALRGSYRGGDNDHDYNWFDPYARSAAPNDGNGHGTHTMGTIAGTNGIGVAPGAKWIAAKGCRSSSCYTSDLLESFEFMVCPTKTDGSEPDCSKAPHVVNNSWGGGQGTNTYYELSNALIAAGIIPVFSQGNSGSYCSTANSPGDNDNVIGVGATDINDNIAYFSSRGPAVKTAFTGSQKPEISAPGYNVRSSYYTSDTAYSALSGTSMASPHVTGAIALILKHGEQSYLDVLNVITETADTSSLKTAGQNCGGVNDAYYPNFTYGYGRINVCSAVKAVGGQC